MAVAGSAVGLGNFLRFPGLAAQYGGGAFMLAYAISFLIIGLPIGWAADRVNRKWLLAAGTALWSLMTAGAGLVRSFGGLFAMRAGVGVGEATLNPCTTSLIVEYFAPGTRPKAFGIYTMSTALGTGVAYLGGGVILGFVGVGSGGRDFDMPLLGPIPAWQAVFIIIGLAGLVPAALLAFTVREPRRRDVAVAGSGSGAISAGAFLRQNAVTLACHHVGVALIVPGQVVAADPPSPDLAALLGRLGTGEAAAWPTEAQPTEIVVHEGTDDCGLTEQYQIQLSPYSTQIALIDRRSYGCVDYHVDEKQVHIVDVQRLCRTGEDSQK